MDVFLVTTIMGNVVSTVDVFYDELPALRLAFRVLSANKDDQTVSVTMDKCSVKSE